MGRTRQPKSAKTRGKKGEKARENRYVGKRIINRELSWLAFNQRVQAEADNPDNPLLERAKFLAIVTSNLDEFMQVRYGRTHRAATGGQGGKRMQGGFSAKSLYRRVNKSILHQQNLQYMLYEGIRSELYLKDVQLYPIFHVTDELHEREAEIFKNEIKTSLRQLAPGEAPQQKRLHLLLKLVHTQRKTSRFVILALPASLPRIYDLSTDPKQRLFIRVEDIVRHHFQSLFAKEQVAEAAAFRVIRNQSFPIELTPEEDYPQAVRKMLRLRRYGQVMRLEAEERMSEEMLSLLMRRFSLAPEQRYRVTGPLDLNTLMMTLYGELRRGDLKYKAAKPVLPAELMAENIFAKIAKKDYVLYHPYHSFAPVVHLMERAARDPAVRAIKQTLYRVSSNSPIVQALEEAAENGKEVTVLFEAYARFDEENNLFWAGRLRKAGCRVILGIPGLKTHSKITLIEREERKKIRRYLHLGTGNYHDGTAKLYTDFGLLTANPELGQGAAAFFEGLMGSEAPESQALIRAPEDMKASVLALIEREKNYAQEGRSAGIIAKMNALSDEDVIAALYSASSAGVRIRLIVRGICCLRAGRTDGNLQVMSIVGRYLEHARAFCFENGGEKEVYLSSADWMPRNLKRRVELMFPVLDTDCKRAVCNILELQWQDTAKASRQQKNGDYIHADASEDGAVNTQELLLEHLEDIMNKAIEAIEAIEAGRQPSDRGVHKE